MDSVLRGGQSGIPTRSRPTHAECVYSLSKGYSPWQVAIDLVTNGVLSPAEAQTFVSTAMGSYDNCP